MIYELERIVRGENDRLMILMPPGAAKSTYSSKLLPPWYLAQDEGLTILACSHSAELATSFGRVARNYAEGNERWLGYTLRRDSKAADEWETTNGGRFFCNGVGAGLSGHRADLGLIDDFCGKEEDVNSKPFNDKVWNWYLNDFIPRLKPGAARVIIANHRNEDDLVGRLIQREGDRWHIIRLRLIIENEEQAEDDPLGRQVGEWLWPEYFTEPMVKERMSNPRSSGIEQQDPTPESGVFFKNEWFKTYKTLPPYDELSFYCASDHAVSERETADPTCIIPAAWSAGKLYIHRAVIWKRIGSKEAVEAMLRTARDIKPVYWWAEKGHITKSIGPFLRDRMLEEKVFANIIEVTPVKDKMTRAQSIQGMMSMGIVYFPEDAEWLQRAKREMLSFPNGRHDDFVDAIAHLGRGVVNMGSPIKRPSTLLNEPDESWRITPRWIKESAKRKLRIQEMRD